MSILDWSIQQATLTTAQIAASSYVPLTGQLVWNSQTGQYKIGDGSTTLSALTYYGGSSSLTVGTSAISGGTNTRILYNNNGVLGEYLVTGTGTTAVLSTSPTFTTSIITPKIDGVSSLIALTTNTIHTTTGSFCAGRSNPDRPIEVYSSTGIATMQAYSTHSTSYAGVYAQGSNALYFGQLLHTSASYVTNGILKADNVYIGGSAPEIYFQNGTTGDVVISTGGYPVTNERARFTTTTTTFSNSIFKVGNSAGTGVFTFRDLVGTASTSNAIYVGTATPSASNYILAWDTASTYVNAIGANSVYIQAGATNVIRIGSTFCIFSDGVNIQTNTTTGTKIGTATTQKIGFWNATPIVQPSGATQAAPAAYATGAFGLDSDANMQALYDLVVAMRTAMVNSGLMKGAA